MNTATLVYEGTPMLGRSPIPGGNILGMFKQKKFLKKMNDELLNMQIAWEVKLDNSIADIDLLAKESDAIICVPGLQKQFDFQDFPEEKVYYLDSLEYYNLDATKVIQFLKKLSLWSE